MFPEGSIATSNNSISMIGEEVMLLALGGDGETLNERIVNIILD